MPDASAEAFQRRRRFEEFEVDAKKLAVWCDAVLCRQLRSLYAGMGVQIVASGSFDGLCATVHDEPCDAVVVTLKPWNVSAPEVADLISARRPRPKVVVITPDSGLMTEAEAARLGAFALLSAPVRGEEIFDVLNRALFVPG